MDTSQSSDKEILTGNFVCLYPSFSYNLQIAGGSGITPMLQVIDTIVKNPEDNTKVISLLLPYFFTEK